MRARMAAFSFSISPMRVSADCAKAPSAPEIINVANAANTTRLIDDFIMGITNLLQ
jgi:hypothetical protein